MKSCIGSEAETMHTVGIGNHAKIYHCLEGVRCMECNTTWRPGDCIGGPCISHRDPRPIDVNPETGDAI